MRIAASLVAAVAASVALAVPMAVESRGDGLADSEAQFTEMVQKIMQAKATELEAREKQAQQSKARHPTKRCTAKNIVFRREYGALSQQERLDYVKAVKCLMRLPARTPPSVASGARSRFDDFIVAHILQTLTIHFTGNFQAWHRWFVYTYEKALRDECGYKGYQPYWDWPKYASSPQTSPIFNGDPYSLGGNGEYIPHSGVILLPPPGDPTPPLQLPPGLGGGYVTTGPFANMTVNLGPVGGYEGVVPGPEGGLGYNPRRFKRDVGPAVSMRYTNYSSVLHVLLQPEVDGYRLLLEGALGTPEIGVHGGGHYTIGGDPGSDPFISPGDPAFWVHHGNMDRMWALWQNLDPTKKRFTDLGSGIYAHRTFANNPPSPLATLDDVIDMGYAGESVKIRDVMDTTRGPLCYFYA